MIQSKSMTGEIIFLYKHAPDGLIAHVYEHVVANFIEAELHKNGLYSVIDYSLSGKTYGYTCFIEIRSYSKSASRIIEAVLEFINKSRLDDGHIESAALECGLEYGASLRSIGPSFTDAVKFLHNQPWSDFSELESVRAEDSTSVNTTFSTDGASYHLDGGENSKEVAVHFEADFSTYRDNPARKALAVLLVQAVSLNVLRHLRSKFVLYDSGDEWDEGAQNVAYRNFLVLDKHVDESSLLSESNLAVSAMAEDSALATSIRNLLISHYTKERSQYFSLETMNRITGGVVIGYKGWLSVSSDEVIGELLRGIKVDLV